MDIAFYEKVIIENPDFPIVVLENNITNSLRQQLCPLHWHEPLELHYIIEGTLDISVNQTQYSLRAGDLIVLNSNDTHSSSCAGRLKERILIFLLDDLSKSLANAVPAFQRVITQDQQVMSLMTAFEEEFLRKPLGYEAACKGNLLMLIAYLSRNYTLSAASGQAYRRHTQLLQRFLPVTEYIALHFAEPISTETLASLIYVSKDRFNHLFKECMGISLRKYINDIRLHSAYGWLEHGQCAPAEAASMAGFTDYNHFGRLFRQTFGCTPSQVLHKNSKIV